MNKLMSEEELCKLEVECIKAAQKRRDIRTIKAIMTCALLRSSPKDEQHKDTGVKNGD